MYSRSRIILVLSIIAALAVGLGGGYYLWHEQQSEPIQSLLKEVVNHDEGKPDTVDFGLFWQVWNKLHEKYVDKEELDTQALVTGAIQGMVAAAGDPHTVYLEPVTNKKFQEDISGEFSGVGIEITVKDGNITVVAPLKNTPAERAGMEAGDVITDIDDVSTENMTIEEAVTRIRGKRGTTVKLGVFREGVTETLVFPVVRDTITIPSLELTFLEGNVAYLQLFTFNLNIDEEFTQAARRIQEAGAQRLILDVRSNPGGLLDASVNLAGWFLPQGTLVVKEDFGGGISQSMRSAGNAQLGHLKMVILIDGGSASASEILAGAIHDNLGVPLVGETTFGKGSVQQLEPFSDGSSLKVTVAKWLTPNGISISEEGIAPTEVVEISPETTDNGDLEFGIPGKDPQLDRALEIVNTL